MNHNKMGSTSGDELLFIRTGGTIDKGYPKRIGGYAFEIGEPATGKILKRVMPAFSFKNVSIAKKDSQEITDQDRENIWNVCSSNPNTRIIITHGTDTMIETAKYLKRKGLEDKYVVLTGAFLPETFKDSDAEFNVGLAVGAVQCLSEPGVYVAMNGQVHPADKVTRDPNLGCFISLNT